MHGTYGDRPAGAILTETWMLPTDLLRADIAWIEGGSGISFSGIDMMHPTAVIHPKARIATGVKIGPYAVIDEHVEVGSGCEIGPHVYLTGATVLGTKNRIHAGAVIGDLPQDLRFKGGETKVVIGNDNVIREHVTIHRSNKMEEATQVGSNTLLMAH